jgi:hypothetical protein
MGARSLPLLIVCLACALPARAQTLQEAEAQSQLAWQTQPLPLVPPRTTVPLATPAAGSATKSPWAAVGLSLLLPGAGHIYGDAPGRAKIFLGAEAVIWSLALVFDRREAWKSEDAVDFAVAHAQLNPSGKDDEFLEHLEFYQNRDEYNSAGRVIDPSRPYVPETPDTYWEWDEAANREAYRDLRNSAETAGRNRTFAFYGALLNRVVAAVDAFRIVHNHNANSKKQQGLKLSLNSGTSWNDPRLLVQARLVF